MTGRRTPEPTRPTGTVPSFLLAWAALPGPAKVLAAARTRAESRKLGTRAMLEVGLAPAERAEVGRMLAPSWTAGTDPVPVLGLRRALEPHGVTLEEVLVAVGGPLRDLPAERAAARSSRASDRERGLALLASLSPTEINAAARERCLVGADSWAQRAEQIATVIRHLDARLASDAGIAASGRLPHATGGGAKDWPRAVAEDSEARQPIRLGVLAVRLFGDAHALDRSTGLGRAVARFAAGRAASPYVDPVSDPAAWHEAWASVGVMCDGVSTQVLVLNLPLVGDGPAARLCAVAGEPVWLTLRMLRHPFALAEGTAEVFVCENPAVVEAAADAFGAVSRPLVCTFGLPNLASTTLLSVLAPSTTLRVRADGDAAGWSIVGRLLDLPGAEPWRMPDGLDAYEEALLDDLLHDLDPTP